MARKQWNSHACGKMGMLWKDYFADPSLWYNNLNNKCTSRSPDFRHLITNESLWIHGWCNPTWVCEEVRRRKVIFPTLAIDNVHVEGCISYMKLLKACAEKKDLYEGIRLHDEVLRLGLLEKSPHLAPSLLSMYAKCSSLSKAQDLFDEIPIRNIISWNALIGGYAQQGLGQEALNCFEHMKMEGLSPDVITFICILKACGCIGDIDKGIEIHDEIVLNGYILDENIMLATALVDMYAKCCMLAKAQNVIEELSVRNKVIWSALLAGYVQQAKGYDALMCFERMRNEGLSLDAVTFISILKACGIEGAIEEGKRIHNEIASRGLLGKSLVLGNALVDMYTKCGAIEKAHQVHDELPVRNVISWSALIAGYIQQGKFHEALNCFEQMQSDGFSPNAITFTSILKACGSMGAVDKGKQIHDEIASTGLLDKDVVLGNALVDMYTKCGSVIKAEEVLHELRVRNVISWSILIAGYAQQGQGLEAMNCFEQMKSEGFSPDAITFVSLLNACNHSGMMNEAETYYGNMSKKYGIAPNLEHHTSMVIIYGFEGHFDKAMCVMKMMPSSSYPEVWLALLGACRKRGALKLGRMVFDQAIQLNDSCAAAYVLMADIYAAFGKIEGAKEGN